jgi:hypothetical protein
VKEGAIRFGFEMMREKKERESEVLGTLCFTVGNFFCPMMEKVVRLREEWRGRKEYREMMWMVEEEGGVDCGISGKWSNWNFWVDKILMGIGMWSTIEIE